MAWRRSDNKPLFEPMMVRLLIHICVTRPQWVKLIVPSGEIDQSQHYFGYRLVAWQHQAITWTNVDLSSRGFCDIHLRVMVLQGLKIPIELEKLHF